MGTKRIDRGVVYGISGLPWLNEALVSAKSLKQVMPELPIELHIDRNTLEQLGGQQSLAPFFDFITVHPAPAHWRTLKFAALGSKRFSRTLFLDSDTYLTDGIGDLFDITDQFDIGIFPAPQRIHDQALKSRFFELFPTVPLLFPEHNTGVISFAHNQKTIEFLKQWELFYEEGLKKVGYTMDQASARVALYHSDLRIFSLPPEVNFRAMVPNIVKGKVRIIHAHGDLEAIAGEINNKEGMRIIVPNRNLLSGFLPKGLERVETFTNEQVDRQRDQIRATIEKLMNQQ